VAGLSDAFLVPLFHGAAMLLFPAMMGLSTALCVRSSPSPFSIVSVHEYVSLTRPLDRLWLVAAATWTALALSRGAELWSGSWPAVALSAAAAIALLLMLGAHLWFHDTLAPELARTAEDVEDQGAVTTIDDDGTLVARRRQSGDQSRIDTAARGVRLYLVGAVSSVATFVAVAAVLGAFYSTERFFQCLLVGAFYSSLGVFFIDLIEDVWPGFTTQQRLARSSRYYVQIFEQWKNWGVLVAFLTVLVGAPYAWRQGYVPVAAISFPVWIGGCLIFATFFNQVLHRAGLVNSRLPLPVYVNQYSVKYPLWAHFFTVIHIVMAACLTAGLIAGSATLRHPPG